VAAYGGAASQSAPGAPIYTGVTPPPFTGSALPYAPPPVPASGNNKRGLWLGLGAAGLVALIAVIGFFAFAGKSTPSTATASPGGGTAVSSTTGTAGTPQTGGTAGVAFVGSPVPANAYIVADAKNLITYAYPKEWHAGGVTEFDTDIVAGYTIFNPYSIFSVAKEDVVPSTTLDSYTDDYIARRFRKSPDWKPGPINKQNAKIAGQEARIIDFLQPSTSDGGIAPKGGIIYQYLTVTLHDNRAWTIGYATANEQKDVAQKQFDVLANTFAFCPTTGCGRQQTVPTIAAGQTTKWADTAKLLTAEYPADWFAYPDDKAQDRSLALSSPDGVFFNIYAFDTTSTVDEEMQAILDNHAKATDFKYTDTPVTDVTIAGEPGKFLSYTYVPASDPSAKARNALVWVVNHGGKEFAFQALDTKARRADIEKIVGSVAFTGPSATATPRATPVPTARPTVVATDTPKPQRTPTVSAQSLTTWSDPDGVIKFQYPSSWTASKVANSPSSAVLVSDANGVVGVSVFIYDPGTETIDQNFQRIRDTASNDGKTVRVYDPVLDTKVGGLPAKSVAYRYTPIDQPNSTPGIATIWIVDHNGKRYEFFGSDVAVGRAQIEAVIGSVVFLK